MPANETRVNEKYKPNAGKVVRCGFCVTKTLTSKPDGPLLNCGVEEALRSEVLCSEPGSEVPVLCVWID
jgi:hypothetical protein